MSFVRKELKMAFLCISVGVLALSYPLFVSASTDFITDDFESYELGNLNAQGVWSATNCFVIDTQKHSGDQGASCAGNAIGTATKNDDGEQWLFINIPSDTDHGSEFYIYFDCQDSSAFMFSFVQYHDNGWYLWARDGSGVDYDFRIT